MSNCTAAAEKIAEDFLENTSFEIAEITGRGEVNKIYLITYANGKIILRLNDIHEIDRFKKERWAIEAATDSGVNTPKCLSLNTYDKYAYMVMEFVGGQNGTDIVASDSLWFDLGGELKKIHSTACSGFGEGIADLTADNNDKWRDYLAYNLESLDNTDVLVKRGILTTSSSSFLLEQFKSLSESNFNFGLSHGDFSLANTIVGNQAYIIDWGCAQAHITPHYDLSVILGESLGRGSSFFNALLKGYGIDDAEFEVIEKDVASLALLTTVDKLRWAIDKSPDRVDHYMEKLSKLLPT